jgi:hypothetical protein
VTPCSPVGVYRRFGGTWCNYYQGLWISRLRNFLIKNRPRRQITLRSSQCTWSIIN